MLLRYDHDSKMFGIYDWEMLSRLVAIIDWQTFGVLWNLWGATCCEVVVFFCWIFLELILNFSMNLEIFLRTAFNDLSMLSNDLIHDHDSWGCREQIHSIQNEPSNPLRGWATTFLNNVLQKIKNYNDWPKLRVWWGRCWSPRGKGEVNLSQIDPRQSSQVSWIKSLLTLDKSFVAKLNSLPKNQGLEQ